MKDSYGREIDYLRISVIYEKINHDFKQRSIAKKKDFSFLGSASFYVLYSASLV